MENTEIEYLVGVDGGGTGTRLILANHQGHELARSEGPPSALNQGVEQAWTSILKTLELAFNKIAVQKINKDKIAIGLGLSGVNNGLWRQSFLQLAPQFAELALDTDGFTTLFGAHAGAPGVIVAIGTGSVGMVLDHQGQRKTVSGWGYPAGDEASGAWMGLRAAAVLQKTLDGRQQMGPLAQDILSFCGGNENLFLEWLGKANQNHFAQLAPLVINNGQKDRQAKLIIQRATEEIELMIMALDPKSELPLSICGRLGEILTPQLSGVVKNRSRPPIGDSSFGALQLIRAKLEGTIK